MNETTKKKFLTTCYSRISKLPTGTRLVQTSNGSPKWLAHVAMTMATDLCPAAFRIGLEGEAYEKHYRKQLERLLASGKLKYILDTLPEGSAFLCYEADHNECHRKLLAEFIVEKGLAEVKEFSLGPQRPPLPPIDPQISLL